VDLIGGDPFVPREEKGMIRLCFIFTSHFSKPPPSLAVVNSDGTADLFPSYLLFGLSLSLSECLSLTSFLLPWFPYSTRSVVQHGSTLCQTNQLGGAAQRPPHMQNIPRFRRRHSQHLLFSLISALRRDHRRALMPLSLCRLSCLAQSPHRFA
jgi:hypothetical protein